MIRAHKLAERFPPEAHAPRADRRFPAAFRGRAPRHSPAYRAASLVLLLVVPAAVCAVGWCMWGATAALDGDLAPVGDARLTDDYRRRAANDWDGDGPDLLLATADGPLRLRTDAGRVGVWEDLNGRAGTALAEKDLRRVRFFGGRVFFVGAEGTLASCGRPFDDWRVHRGRGGFEPGLDLSAQLTCLAASPDGTVFAAGGAGCGLGIYDTISRQWSHLSPSAGGLKGADVRAAVFQGGRLWVGGDGGLDVFSVRRTAPGVELTRDAGLYSDFRRLGSAGR